MSRRPRIESPAERKTRERLEFLALPPAEAQRRIRLTDRGPIRDITPPGQDLRSPLAPVSDDETVDE
jgi:hypothetical protein